MVNTLVWHFKNSGFESSRRLKDLKDNKYIAVQLRGWSSGWCRLCTVWYIPSQGPPCLQFCSYRGIFLWR